MQLYDYFYNNVSYPLSSSENKIFMRYYCMAHKLSPTVYKIAKDMKVSNSSIKEVEVMGIKCIMGNNTYYCKKESCIDCKRLNSNNH